MTHSMISVLDQSGECSSWAQKFARKGFRPEPIDVEYSAGKLALLRTDGMQTRAVLKQSPVDLGAHLWKTYGLNGIAIQRDGVFYLSGHYGTDGARTFHAVGERGTLLKSLEQTMQTFENLEFQASSDFVRSYFLLKGDETKTSASPHQQKPTYRAFAARGRIL